MKTAPTRRQVRDALRQVAEFAVDTEKACAASASLGLDKPERTRAAPTKRPGASESQVLTAVLALLRRHPAVAWVERMNVAAFEADDRYIRCGFVGLSDILGQMRDGRILCVEVKREHGGRVSSAQQAFIDKVRAHGGVGGIVRSADEAALLIKYATTGGQP